MRTVSRGMARSRITSSEGDGLLLVLQAHAPVRPRSGGQEGAVHADEDRGHGDAIAAALTALPASASRVGGYSGLENT